jgi:hypothetical protein
MIEASSIGPANVVELHVAIVAVANVVAKAMAAAEAGAASA